MKYAHIYNARGGKFTLLITSGPAISAGVIFDLQFISRKEAKIAAKTLGATPYNY